MSLHRGVWISIGIAKCNSPKGIKTYDPICCKTNLTIIRTSLGKYLFAPQKLCTGFNIIHATNYKFQRKEDIS